MANPWDALPDATPSASSKKSGNPWDALPDAQQQSGPRHPSQMSDDEIALGLMKIDPAKWERVKKSRSYREGAVKDLFTDPEGYWGSYVVGKNKDLPGSSANRAVQSLFAGANKAKLAGGQLVGQLLSKVTGGDYDTWNEIQVKANEINQNINQGRKPEEGGLDPANIVGQGVFGAAGSKGAPTGSLPTRLAGQSGLAAADAMVTTPGTPRERAKSAAIAGTVAPVVGGVSAGAKSLIDKAKSKAYKLGQTPSVKETLDELGSRFSGQEPGDALQSAAKAKYGDAWSEARAAYAPVDAVKDSVSVNLEPGIRALDDIITTAESSLSPMHPAQLGLLKEVRDRAAKAGSAPMSDVMTLVSDLGKNLFSLQKQHGSMIDRDAFEGVKDAFIGAMSQADNVAAKDLAAGNSVFASKVGPLIKNKKLVELRDTDKPGDFLRSLAQGPLKNVKPQATAEIAAGSSPDPILYQYLENAATQAGDRPGGFIPSLTKTLPSAELIDPKMADVFSRQIDVANTAKTGGAAVNYLAGKLFGTPATVVGSFNPAISGPGGVWGALQNPAVRDRMTKFGTNPGTTEAQEALRAIFAGQMASGASQ